MVHGAFYHSLRHRRTVFRQDVLFQAAAVDADADGHVLGVAGVGHSLDAVVAADVAGVDADFVRTRVQGGQRSAVVKVDISHDRDIHLLFDGGHDGGVRRGGHRHADDLAAGLRHALGLGHIARYVLDRHIQHSLHGNRVRAADFDIANLDFLFQLTLHRCFSFIRIV